VRAYLDSGERVTLRDAFIVRDSLMYASAQGGALPGHARGIPLQRIRRIEAQRADAAATGLLVVATVGIVVAAVVVIVAVGGISTDIGGFGTSNGAGIPVTP
jgi:hypothetical protein